VITANEKGRVEQSGGWVYRYYHMDIMLRHFTESDEAAGGPIEIFYQFVKSSAEFQTLDDVITYEIQNRT
jgi:hypothetical protein